MPYALLAMGRKTSSAFLPYVGRAVAQARRDAHCPRVQVAARVKRKSGVLGVSDSTLARFETGKVWPENPDAVVSAYADALGLEPCELWARALDGWKCPGRKTPN